MIVCVGSTVCAIHCFFYHVSDKWSIEMDGVRHVAASDKTLAPLVISVRPTLALRDHAQWGVELVVTMGHRRHSDGLFPTCYRPLQ
jgi:hypothetical protein